MRTHTFLEMWMPDTWKVLHKHLFSLSLSFMAYVFRLLFGNLASKKKETLIASCLFYFSFPFPPFIKLHFFRSFSWCTHKTLPSFHSDVTSLLGSYWPSPPQFLALGRKRNLTREIILVVCQDFNHQEETDSDQSCQESTPEKQVTVTQFHLVTITVMQMGWKCESQV